jgi:hypothetical protein
VKSIREQVAEQFRHTVVGGLAATTPIPRETHRAVVQQVLERAWTAERELKDFRRRLVELEADQRRLADLEQLWSEACAVAKTHCPCDVGRSHFTQGIPRLFARAERANAERDVAQARLRSVTQTLVTAVGAEGPCNAEEAAERVVARLASRYVAGRASALAEIVTLLEDDRALIEQIEEIKP